MSVATPDIPAITPRIVASEYLTFVLGNESYGMTRIKGRAQALLDIDRVVSGDTVARLAMAATPFAALTCWH